jgi:hypothetical protein
MVGMTVKGCEPPVGVFPIAKMGRYTHPADHGCQREIGNQMIMNGRRSVYGLSKARGEKDLLLLGK